MPSQDRHINFALLRDRVLGKQEGGKQFWRSLEEMADTPEFQEFIEREYPQHAEEWNDPFSRRTFIKLMGASLALAGLSGCVYQPPEKIVPYVRQPEEEVPGKPLYFATAMSLTGAAMPLLVKSNEGRPTKIEGNDMHRMSEGATDVFSQASLLTMYDPDRSQTATYRGEQRPWSAFLGELHTALEEQKAKKGAGIRILTETVISPTLYNQLRTITAPDSQYSQAIWHQYEPAGSSAQMAGAMMAYGQPVNTVYDFSKADRILSLDSDFLACGPSHLRYARDFTAKRRITEGRTEMSRLYVVESTLTNTGAKADHRLALKPSEVEAFARAVATRLGANAGNGPQDTAHADWINALVNDLQQHSGASIVIAGDEQSAAVHALAHAINDKLGNVGDGKPVSYTDPIEFNPVDQMQELRTLVGDINNNQVDLLVILGGNPVYNAPADLGFNLNLLSKVKLRVHLSLYKDETSELCQWHIPEAHYLESWGDARAADGTVTIIQPLIAPLYEGRTAHEVLSIFSDQFDRKPYDIVRDYWQSQNMGVGGQGTGQSNAAQTNNAGPQTTNAAPQPAQPKAATSNDFDQAWRKALHDGFISNSALKPKAVTLNPNWTTQNATNAQTGGLEINFRTDPSVYDGRFANNGWLQELPRPLTKITWDNVALISPATARQLKINSAHATDSDDQWLGADNTGSKGGDNYADVIQLKYRGQVVNAPAWIQPGQPDNVITVHLGYGRERAGRVGGMRETNVVGFNAFKLRTSDAPWFGAGLEIVRTGEQHQICTTQLHFNMEGRDIVRVNKLEEFLHEKPEKSDAEERAEFNAQSMYPQYHYDKESGNEYAWGMAIDTASCVGCNACVVACQSENNIPIVGKEQVGRSREMHWLRIDAYFEGQPESPAGPYFMPVLCMHCENAPCEPVCPVHATVHSAEGLNDMVYNRCVGTRYCSNNCPYKVRRFNFLLYQDWNTPTYKLMRNPEVSVRSRGVMEKCTYCVQRIQWAKIESEKEGRSVRDGEILTACQASCPTEAIVFGNINDPESRVAKLKRERRNYSLLGELNTQPRTTYLAEMRNPNPEISEKA